MNDIYTNTNPSEHLHYDPLLLHQENEKNSKSNKQHENGEHKENKDLKADNSQNNKTNIIIKDTAETSTKKNGKKGESVELPEHWEQRRTPEGLIYYANHQTKTTQWHHPYYNNLYSPSNTSNTVTNDTISTKDEKQKHHTSTTTEKGTEKNKGKEKGENQTHHKRRKNRSNSVVEMDGFIRVLRTPPKHVKVGYSTILFSSHPSLSLQITPTAQNVCDWLNSQRKMNFRIDNITINLNRSLMKGLHLWMTVYRDNSTRRSYDRSRQWKCKVFGLSSIAMTLDPHLHGNSKTSKVMTDFLTWRSSLPPQVDVIYTLSYSRTYSCVLALYLSLNPREDPTNRMTSSSDQAGEREGDISYHKPRHHHHHHHHKDGDHPAHHHHHGDHHGDHHHHHHKQQEGDHPHHHHHDDANHPHHHHHDDRDHPHHHHHDDHPHHHHGDSPRDVSKENKISHSENKNEGVAIDPKHAVGSEGEALHRHQHQHDQKEISDHENDKDKGKEMKGGEGLDSIKKEEEKNRILTDPNSNPPPHSISGSENAPKPSLDHPQNQGEVLHKDVKGDIKLDNKDGGTVNKNNNNEQFEKNDDFNVHNNPPAEFT